MNDEKASKRGLPLLAPIIVVVLADRVAPGGRRRKARAAPFATRRAMFG
jgi:hypothetical protein